MAPVIKYEIDFILSVFAFKIFLKKKESDDMRGRAFIQAVCKYPHGTPGANYLDAFSRLLIECGMEVVLITDRNTDYRIDEIEVYDGFHTEWIEERNNPKDKVFQTRTGFADDRINAMKKWNANSHDLIFVYALDHPTFQDQIIAFSKVNKIKLISFVLEFMEERKNIPIDRRYNALIYYIPKYFDGVISISDFISDYYVSRGIPTCKIPPMIKFNNNIYEKSVNKWNIIFPANGGMKDDLVSLLQGISLLGDESLGKVHLDLMGVKKEEVDAILSNEWEKVKNVITVHTWMKYEELTRLYEKARVLLLPRKTNQTTIANFPSKVPEVMNYGVIPVVSAVGDYTKYYLKDGINSIVMRGSSGELCAEALIRIINMPTDEVGSIVQAIYDTAKNCFDFHNWVGDMEEFLKKIAK